MKINQITKSDGKRLQAFEADIKLQAGSFKLTLIKAYEAGFKKASKNKDLHIYSWLYSASLAFLISFLTAVFTKDSSKFLIWVFGIGFVLSAFIGTIFLLCKKNVNFDDMTTFRDESIEVILNDIEFKSHKS